jgi:hypothetical protein
MKLSQKRKYQLETAFRDLNEILVEMEKRKLRGRALEKMKLLQDACIAIGILILDL